MVDQGQHIHAKRGVGVGRPARAGLALATDIHGDDPVAGGEELGGQKAIFGAEGAASWHADDQRAATLVIEGKCAAWELKVLCCRGRGLDTTGIESSTKHFFHNLVSDSSHCNAVALLRNVSAHTCVLLCAAYLA